MLSSLLSYHNGKLAPDFAQSMLDMRLLVETETARLAAQQRTDQHLEEFRAILVQEFEPANNDPQTLTDLDFSFHLSIAVASANLVYPLLINSFKGVYTSLTGEFFHNYVGTQVVEEVHQFHRRLVSAFEKQDTDSAVQTMTEMLRHGEDYLKGERP